MVAKCLDPAWHRAHPDPYSCREVVTFRMTAPGLKRSIVFSRPTPPELYRG